MQSRTRRTHCRRATEGFPGRAHWRAELYRPGRAAHEGRYQEEEQGKVVKVALEPPNVDSLPESPAKQLPVALLTPTGADGSIAQRILRAAGMISHVCTSMDEVCTLISRDEAAVLVIAEEALDAASRIKLFESL